MPVSVLSAVEHEAARSGRTWNDQLSYVLGLLLGKYPPDFEDMRSAEDWRTLLRPCGFRFRETEDWSPFTCLDHIGQLRAQAKQKGR